MKKRKLLFCLSIMIAFTCSNIYAQKMDTIIREFENTNIQLIFLNSHKEKKYYKKNPKTTIVTIDTCIHRTDVDVFIYKDSLNHPIKEILTPYCITLQNESVLMSQFILKNYFTDAVCLETMDFGRDYYEITLLESGSIYSIDHVRARDCQKKLETIAQILTLVKSIHFKGETPKSFFVSINTTMTCSSYEIEKTSVN